MSWYDDDQPTVIVTMDASGSLAVVAADDGVDVDLSDVEVGSRTRTAPIPICMLDALLGRTPTRPIEEVTLDALLEASK